MTRALPWLMLAGLLFVAAAAAQSDADRARADFHAGVTHARRGDWEAALASFDAAYRGAPQVAVLFNLAGAQFRCGKLLASNTNYRRLLATAGDALTRAQRAAAQRQIALIERRMPRLRVNIQGLRSDDRVLLDQARLYPDELGRDMWVDPGTHRLEVIRARGRPELRTAVLGEGESQVLALSLP